MVKIKDIAQRAKVSLSAVSIALNGKKGLAVETRERILNIAHEMNYQQSNRNPGRGVIRFLKIALHGNTINEAHSLFISGYIDGMIEQTGKLGFTLEVIGYTGRSIKEIVELQNQAPFANGLVILGTEFEQEDFNLLRRLEPPFVIIDNINDFLPYDFVNMNNRGAVYKVLNHFQHAGLTRIGLIYSDAHTPNFRQRDLAFRELTASLGLRCDPQDMVCVNSNSEAAYAKMRDYLSASSTLAQGYFCVNDAVAYGCIRALKDHGVRVPQDVSVIGFDDLPISAVMDPALTTIKVSNKKMGMSAIDLLAEKIAAGRVMSHTNILISGMLIKRNSVIRHI